jgi:hypothetical protein
MSSARMRSEGPFWPDGARLAVSISMQFEAGAQPDESTSVGRPNAELNVADVIPQYSEAARYAVASNSRVSVVNARRLG